MVDRYTKIVLTIIASALAVLALEQAVPKAVALGDGCGGINNPCYVKAADAFGLEVNVVRGLR